jgi:hypothetical protein
VNTEFDEAIKSDSTLAENIIIQTISNSDSSHFDLTLENSSYKTNMKLGGTIWPHKDSSEVIFTNSSVESDGIPWSVNSEKIKISYDPEIEIPSLKIIGVNQTIKVFGTIGKDNSKGLRCMVDNLDLDIVDNYLQIDLSSFSGNLNGQFQIFSILGKPYFDAGIIINPIIYNEMDTLGMLRFTSNENLIANQINIDGILVSPDFYDILKISGYLDYSNNINMTIDIPESNISYFEGFAKDYISDLKGYISGQIILSGKIEEPEIRGTVKINEAAFTVNYLQTSYKFTHEFAIDQQKITVKDLNLYDEYFNIAAVRGKIGHDYFDDFSVDLNISTKDLYCLNTTYEDNNIFYGQAFADGILDITGPIDDIKFDIKAVSRDNTKIYLPVYGDDEYREYKYLRYTSPFDKQRYKPQSGLLGIAINMDVEINPSTDVEIIFNPDINDKITGNGKGILKIDLDNLGNVYMYGSYYIESGEYIFTTGVKGFNLIKRRFNVQEGSVITWKGDPEEAEIDIEAIHELKADINELSSDNSSGIVDVKAKIFLTESLFLPTISLDFDIVDLGSISSSETEINQKIRIIKSSQLELNKQVMSLLALGMFAPVESGLNFEEAFEKGLPHNISTLASNILAQWLSEASNNFDSKLFGDFKLGVDYSKHNLTPENQEGNLNVLLSTSLFEDRVTINGSYDISNDQHSSDNNVPNLEVSYRGKKKRNTRVKIFSKSDDNPIYNQSTTRVGFGVFFTKEFDRFRDLFIRTN